MTTQEQYIERLKELVKARYGADITSLEDCDALADAVEEATHIRLDGRAFAPLFVAAKRNTALRPVVLSTLARYIGMGSWSDFCAARNVTPAKDADIIPTTRRWGVVILTCVALTIVIISAILLLRSSSESIERREECHSDIIEAVEQEWIASTIEECNAMRAYNARGDYHTMLENFIVEYESEIGDAIATELRSTFAEYGIEVSNIELDIWTESIRTRCIALCDALRHEPTPAASLPEEEVTTAS